MAAMTMPIPPADEPKAEATRLIFVAISPGAIKLTTMAAVISAMKGRLEKADVDEVLTRP